MEKNKNEPDLFTVGHYFWSQKTRPQQSKYIVDENSLTTTMMMFGSQSSSTQRQTHTQTQPDGCCDSSDNKVCDFSQVTSLELGTRTRTKSWNSFSSSNCSEGPAPALTDCSSRSSFQDLDLSVDVDDDEYDEFKDALTSPQELEEAASILDDGPLHYLPSVLRPQQPRCVSFAGTEEILGEREETQAPPRLVSPSTPAIQWYASKGSNQDRLPSHYSPHVMTAHPPLCSAPKRHTKSLSRPRKPALKKQSDAAHHSDASAWEQLPMSPPLRWYPSKC